MIRIASLNLVYMLLLFTSCINSQKTKHNISDHAILIHNANIINVNNGNILENKAILIDSGMIKLLGDYATLKTLVYTTPHL